VVDIVIFHLLRYGYEDHFFLIHFKGPSRVCKILHNWRDLYLYSEPPAHPRKKKEKKYFG
jgi:hypothetical protein